MKLNNNFINKTPLSLLEAWTENGIQLKVNNNSINRVSLGLPDVWKKDHTMVRIIDYIKQIVSSILLKIKIHSFGIKFKFKNLFQQKVDYKIYCHNLKEIAKRGLALENSIKKDQSQTFFTKSVN